MVEWGIRQHRLGQWTVNQCAAYWGIHKSNASRILRGTKRREAMHRVDPSSCAPTYTAPPRPTACPYCDRGNSWVMYEGHMDGLGRLTFYCPDCGRPALS